MAFEFRLKTLPAPFARGIFNQIVEELAHKPLLEVATAHAALFLYGMSTSDKSAQERERGLHKACDEIAGFVTEVSDHLELPELLNTKSLAKYPNMRRILLREYNIDTHNKKEREVYYLFLGILLLYIADILVQDQKFRSSTHYREFTLFGVEDYIDDFFPPSDAINAYAFPRPMVPVSNLIEVLKEEFGIKNPVDERIGDFFKIPSTAPAKYLCYRHTSRNATDFRSGNQITRSYIEISRPTRVAKIYSFRHVYLDSDNIVRETPGFVVHLTHTYYLVGGSRRGKDSPTSALKVIAVPHQEDSLRYDQAFIAGLVLSNDSRLSPIVGRFLLARAKDEIEFSQENCGRIRERDFIKDLRSQAAAANRIDDATAAWLEQAINNSIGDMSKFNTALFPYNGKR